MSFQTLERSSPSPHESENDDQGSLSSYEGFVCREGCAISLSPRPGTSIGKHGGSLRIMVHLKKLNKIMRPQDAIRLAVELEKSTGRPVTRYMVVITTQGIQDTEETIVLGTEQSDDIIKVCLVLPLWRNTEIKLDGDGGFSVLHGHDKHIVFKPCSVQSMWTALQYLFKATDQARLFNYYDGGLSHTWMTFYKAQLTDDGVVLNEWSLQNDLESFRPDSPIYYDVTGLLDWTQLNSEKETLKKGIVSKLREVMLHCDLEEVNSLQLRRKVEEEMKIDLKEYRGFLDQQMLVILGQLEKPSQIHEYLYLGSEWNAANLVELKELGIEYILNITREIDNFYPEAFKYKTVRVFDVPESELLKFWDDTYKFIKEAKANKSKALVHCKMGVSRSAATVIAYTMKEYSMSLESAIEHVKMRRTCINPNHGFMTQLKAYEGILRARYNNLFGTQAPSRITYQNRSSSDPNLRQKLFSNDMEPNDMIDMSGIEIVHEDDHLHMRTSSVNLGTFIDNGIDEYLENRAAHSLPPEKVEGMKSYLASLDVPRLHEEDLGINVHSCSESGSLFSSPLLTPPDDDSSIPLVRMFPEIIKENKEEQNKGEGDIQQQEQDISYDSLRIDDHRVERASSLPITLRHCSMSDAESFCSPPNKITPSVHSHSSCHDSQEEQLDKLSEAEVNVVDITPPPDTVKTTLINSVTQRIKEIEELNKLQETSRPSSAAAGKLDEAILRQTSPSSVEQSMEEEEELPIVATPSPDYITNLISFNRTCDSPNTRYKKATEQAAILLEQKQNKTQDLSASAEDLRHTPLSSAGKGVKQLLDIFDSNSSNLKRSHSLRANNKSADISNSICSSCNNTLSANDIYNSSQQC